MRWPFLEDGVGVWQVWCTCVRFALEEAPNLRWRPGWMASGGGDEESRGWRITVKKKRASTSFF